MRFKNNWANFLKIETFHIKNPGFKFLLKDQKVWKSGLSFLEAGVGWSGWQPPLWRMRQCSLQLAHVAHLVYLPGTKCHILVGGNGLDFSKTAAFLSIMLEKRMLHPFRMLKRFLAGDIKSKEWVGWSGVQKWEVGLLMEVFRDLKKKERKSKTQDQLKPFSNSLMFSLFPESI